MVCHECGRVVQAGDRFCTGCGISLEGVTEPTAPVPTVGPSPTNESPPTDLDATSHDTDPSQPTEAPPTTAELPATELLQQAEGDDWDQDPVWAATGAIPTTDDEHTGRVPTEDVSSGGIASNAVAADAIATSDLPTTEPITEVWMDSVDDDPVIAAGAPENRTPTREVPATAPMPVTPSVIAAATVPDHRFRFNALTLIGIVGGIVLLFALFASVVEITSSSPLVIGENAPASFRTGTWIADDLGDNLSIAGLIAALSMVIGGVAAAFGWRWGSGLAGGGGLATAGLAALVVGLAQFPIDAAHEFAQIPSEQQFTLTITRSLGYWLVIAAGAIGIVAFFASSNDAFGDRRSGLNPWIAALGALSIVVAVTGPLIPEGGALFSDNWYVIERPGEAPAMLVAMRLVQLGLLAVGGVIGFLSVRRWGLGVATGVALPAIWLGISTLFELGTNPVGPGFRNPGATSTELHGVTIIGLSSVLAMLVLAAVAAYDQSR